MLILLRVRLSNEKICQSATLPSLLRFRRAHRLADFEKNSAVVPAFIQFRLEFGETEILADLRRLVFYKKKP
jgi:hypothetical protein